MAYIERVMSSMSSANPGAGTLYPVQTVGGVLYVFYVNALSDVVYIKSSDGGVTWTNLTTVFTGTVSQLSVWYDRWSGIAAGLIHLAYTEVGSSHDTLYRSLDTESSDTLGTQTTVFNGTSAVANNGALSITRARGGNLYVGGMIDAGAEGFFARSTDVGANWSARTDTLNEASATDQFILVPGWAADNQDIMAFFLDDSADEITRKLYDDSGDSWAESTTIISTTIGAAGTDHPHMAAAVDITNSQNLLVAWSARDAANADLRCFKVTESAVTETDTNVVLNSADDQGLAAIGINTATQEWFVAYAGKSDGSETFPNTAHLYYKKSSDGGATWGAETQYSQLVKFRQGLWMVPRFTGPFFTQNYYSESANLFAVSYDVVAGHVIGG